MPGAQIIDFSAPSKSMKMKDTAIDVVKLAAGESEQTIMKMELQPGWNWTGCIRENIPGKPEKCPGSHLGICMKGEFKMYHEDGSVVSAKAGDAYQCLPGHTAEVIGDEAVLLMEFSQAPVLKDLVDKLDK